MLLLTRHNRESIIINDDIEITILKIDKSQVQVGISAPKNVPIFRKEIYHALKQENQASANCPPALFQKVFQGFRKKGL